MPFIIGAMFWLVALVCLAPSGKSGFSFDAQHIAGIVFGVLPLFFWNRYVFGAVMVAIAGSFGAFGVYIGLRDCTLVDTILFITGVTVFVAYFWLGERWFPKKPNNWAVLVATFIVSIAVSFLESSPLVFVPLGFVFLYAGYTWALCLSTNRKTTEEAYAYLKDRLRSKP